MRRPDKPDNEAERLRALHRYDILDTASERSYDDLVSIAAAICGMPMGSVSLIDADRQWFKARIGIGDPQTPRDVAFCAHAILSPQDVTVVNDAREDERFRDNPFVQNDPNIRFYAGAPIVTLDGLAMGTLCVMDSKPRELEVYQFDALNALSRQVSSMLEMRSLSRALKLQLEDRDWYEHQMHAFQDQLEAHAADLSEQVRQDALTKLPNRRAFSAALEQAIDSDGRCCVAVVDIDHFKVINDTHGHLVGDAVLVEVATALRAASGGQGVVARYGGEEFAWLLHEPDIERARLQCEYLREAVAHASAALPVTVSIGLACRGAGETSAQVFERADHALYAAKRAGRNCVVIA